MVVHPRYVLSAGAGERLTKTAVFAQAEGHDGIERLMHALRGHEDDPADVVHAAVRNNAALFSLMAADIAAAPLARLARGEVAAEVAPALRTLLQPWARDFFDCGMTLGDVVVASTEGRYARMLLLHAGRLGVSCLGAALVPRAASSRREMSPREAFGLVDALGLAPGYRAVAVGALLRRRLAALGATLDAAGVYMAGVGVEDAPTLAMYAALCRRDSHAALPPPVLYPDGAVLYGAIKEDRRQTGDFERDYHSDTHENSQSDTFPTGVFERNFYGESANGEQRKGQSPTRGQCTAAGVCVLRVYSLAHAMEAVAVVEGATNPQRVEVIARVAYSVLHAAKCAPVDALALLFDLGQALLSEDDLCAALGRAVRGTRSVHAVDILARHCAFAPHVLAQALVPHVHRERLLPADDALPAAVSFITAVDAGPGGTGTLAVRQKSLHTACSAVTGPQTLKNALDDKSLALDTPGTLVVLLVHALANGQTAAMEGILGHQRVRRVHSLHHALFTACTYAVQHKNVAGLGALLAASLHVGAVGVLCGLLAATHDDQAALECVLAFVPAACQTGSRGAARIARALAAATVGGRTTLRAIATLARTAAACGVDVHAEATSAMERLADGVTLADARLFAGALPAFGGDAAGVAVAAYASVATMLSVERGALAVLCDAAGPVPLAVRLLWHIYWRHWDVVLPELDVDDVVGIFVRCMLDDEDTTRGRRMARWTRDVLEGTRLRVSQRSRVQNACRARALRRALHFGRGAYTVLGPGDAPKDGAACPVCLEDIGSAADTPDALAALVERTVAQAGGPARRACCAVCTDPLEKQARSYSVPMEVDDEMRALILGASCDATAVTLHCPGRHVVHRECLRAWFVRRRSCPLCAHPL